MAYKMKTSYWLTTSQFFLLEYGRASFVGGSATGLEAFAAGACARAAGCAGEVMTADDEVSSSSGQSAGDFFVRVISNWRKECVGGGMGRGERREGGGVLDIHA